MNKLCTALAFCLFFAGCGNLSPRMQPKIDNNQGKINELENLANSLKAEIGKLQNQAEISDSELERVQQGLANYQSNYQNTGVQIFSGPGGLIITMVGFLVIGIVAVAYRQEAKRNLKTADILASRIVTQGDPSLTEQVFQAAMYTDVENKILNLIQKHQDRNLSALSVRSKI